MVFRKSTKGMQRIEMYPNQEDFLQSHNAKIIKLKECISLKPLYGSSGTALSFQLVTSDNEAHQFGTENYSDLQV